MIGQTVSHYEIIEKLGQGGMGVVYLAEDVKLKRKVALKFLPGHDHDEAEEKRFINEAQAASALDHPNICTIYEINETDDGRLFIAMSCYDGETLRERLARGPLSVEEALDIAAQVAEGLTQAHASGIIHRDIKPANIMITSDGVVKILDFGLAKLRGQAKLTQTGTTMGTLLYVSPEQLQGLDVDHRTDIWSLGVVLYEMLAGTPPFNGEYEPAVHYAILNAKPEPVTRKVAGLSPGMTAILNRALAKETARRYSTMSEFREAINEFRTVVEHPVNLRQLLRRLRRPKYAIPVSGLLIAGLVLLILWFVHQKRVAWVRDDALPAIHQLIEHQRFDEAFHLAEEAAAIQPGHPELAGLWDQMSRRVSLITRPAGVNVYIKNYDDGAAPWRFWTQTPIKNERVPFGFFRFKLQKEGYSTHQYLNLHLFAPSTGIVLDRVSETPAGMVRIPGKKAYRFNALVAPVDLADFWLDTYEVTNRQFKRFVDDGGYVRREFWPEKFIMQGKVISWEKAMTRFTDATGQPGPPGWEMGEYPPGRGDYPVNGVSWYEAAAYAAYAGKQLPTAYHFARGLGMPGRIRQEVARLANMNAAEPRPVRDSVALDIFGTYDLCGNVREWIFNASGNRRFVVGGAWMDPIYMTAFPVARSPFDRSPANGFRCMRTISSEPVPGTARQPFPEVPYRDYSRESPVSDEVFTALKRFYTYDRSLPLHPSSRQVDNASVYWTLEKAVFDAAGGHERMAAFLFIPRNVSPPYQVVIHFPQARASQEPEFSQDPWVKRSIDFVVKSGRVVVWPIYTSTFSRRDGFSPVDGSPSVLAWRDHIILQFKDFARTLDYLSTRPDVDMKRIAFYGFSWGGHVGINFLALDDRIRTGILVDGGLDRGGLTSFKAVPEIDHFNFAARITMPVLLVNGRYDVVFPLEVCQEPLFRVLATPAADKKHVLLETGHGLYPYRHIMIREVLAWLDKYLGPIHHD